MNYMTDITVLDDQNMQDYIAYFPATVLREAIDDDEVRLYGIISDDAAVGGIAIRRDFPEVELLWVHVVDEYSGRGIGSEALVSLFLELYREGISDVRITLVPDADPRFKRVVEGFDFVYEETDTGSYTCTLRELRSNNNLMKESKNCESLADTTAKTFNTLVNSIRENGSDLIGEKLNRRFFDEELSTVYMDGEEASGLFLVKKEAQDAYRISFMYSQSENVLAPVEMMRRTFAEGKNLSDETKVSFDLVGEELIEFIETFLGGTVERTRTGVLRLSYIEKIVKDTESFFSYYNLAI